MPVKPVKKQAKQQPEEACKNCKCKTCESKKEYADKLVPRLPVRLYVGKTPVTAFYVPEYPRIGDCVRCNGVQMRVLARTWDLDSGVMCIDCDRMDN